MAHRRSLQHARCSAMCPTEWGRVHEVRRSQPRLSGSLIQFVGCPFCRWDSRFALLARVIHAVLTFRHRSAVQGFPCRWQAFLVHLSDRRSPVEAMRSVDLLRLVVKERVAVVRHCNEPKLALLLCAVNSSADIFCCSRKKTRNGAGFLRRISQSSLGTFQKRWIKPSSLWAMVTLSF